MNKYTSCSNQGNGFRESIDIIPTKLDMSSTSRYDKHYREDRINQVGPYEQMYLEQFDSYVDNVLQLSSNTTLLRQLKLDVHVMAENGDNFLFEEVDSILNSKDDANKMRNVSGKKYIHTKKDAEYFTFITKGKRDSNENNDDSTTSSTTRSVGSTQSSKLAGHIRRCRKTGLNEYFKYKVNDRSVISPPCKSNSESDSMSSQSSIKNYGGQSAKTKQSLSIKTNKVSEYLMSPAISSPRNILSEVPKTSFKPHHASITGKRDNVQNSMLDGKSGSIKKGSDRSFYGSSPSPSKNEKYTSNLRGRGRESPSLMRYERLKEALKRRNELSN